MKNKVFVSVPITQEIIKALKNIEQMSDPGDPFIAVMKMKSIATDTLKLIEQPLPIGKSKIDLKAASKKFDEILASLTKEDYEQFLLEDKKRETLSQLQPSQVGETDYSCKNCGEESTGWTEVKCCNNCGESVEDFWQKPPIVLPSDEEIKEYFSSGYGGDSGSAIYGAKWMRDKWLASNKEEQSK